MAACSNWTSRTLKHNDLRWVDGEWAADAPIQVQPGIGTLLNKAEMTAKMAASKMGRLKGVSADCHFDRRRTSGRTPSDTKLKHDWLS